MADRPNEAESIANLQTYLRQLGYFDPDIPFAPIDGIYESDTRDALSAFQRKNGLPVTGSADRDTWDVLFREYNKSMNEQAVPLPVFFFPRYPIGYEVSTGDDGMVVTVIQLLLRELLTLYGQDDGSLSITGVFDDNTEKAVLNFQATHRVPETGRVDKNTWDLLAKGHRPLVNRFPVQ